MHDAHWTCNFILKVVFLFQSFLVITIRPLTSRQGQRNYRKTIYMDYVKTKDVNLKGGGNKIYLKTLYLSPFSELLPSSGLNPVHFSLIWPDNFFSRQIILKNAACPKYCKIGEIESNFSSYFREVKKGLKCIKKVIRVLTEKLDI